MSEAKHTPGPWRIERRKDDLVHAGCHLIGERPTICIWAHQTGGFYHEVALVHSYDQGPADARLIAAAPELLEALKDLTSIAQDEERSAAPIVFARAESAIAKAEGRL